jgi:CheY-like chemotaxis protein
MPPDVVMHVFEPFFTTKPREKGTGLGLSMVYGGIQQHGGFVEIESEVGAGTTLRLYFPGGAEAAPAAPPPPSAAEDVRGQETVLLVEDEDMLRRMATTVLTRQGFRVLACASAEEARAVARETQGPIHLLLTDVVMPRMGGKELADRIARILPTIRVLYSSGYPDDAIVHHGALDPGTHFLGKPFSASELRKKVREVLDAERHPPDPSHAPHHS